MGIYLDASVLLSSLLAESTSKAVLDFIDSSSEPILVSEFAAAETASSISRLVRTRALTADDAMIRLGDFDIWRARVTDAIEMSDADARLASVFVRRFDLMLKAPDALHVAMASRLRAVLVTLDQRLAKAARELGLTVIQPGHSA